MSRSRVLFCSTLLVVIQLAVSVLAQAPAGSEPLTLRAVSLDPGNGTPKAASVWLSVTNTGKSAQLLCLASRSYTVVSPATGKVGTSTGSPHECDTAESFRLVPAGDTSYWYMEVSLPPRPKETEILVGAAIIAKSLDTNAENRHHIQWTGTIADTEKEGKRIR